MANYCRAVIKSPRGTPSHSYSMYIHPLSFAEVPLNLLSSVGKTSQGCLAENRTRACLTASLPTELCWNLTELRRSLTELRPTLTEIRRTLDCNFSKKNAKVLML